MADHAPAGMICLISKKPYKSYAMAATLFYPTQTAEKTTIHPSAVIDDSAEIGKGIIIEANSVIARGVDYW